MADILLCLNVLTLHTISFSYSKKSLGYSNHDMHKWDYCQISNISHTKSPNLNVSRLVLQLSLLSGVPDFFDRNKILSGGDLSHYQVPHCIRVFFYFVWFVFIHHNFQFYFELCTYCNILDIYLS